MQTVTVPLGAQSYPVWVGSGLIDQVGSLLESVGAAEGSILLVSNDRVFGLYGDRVKASLAEAGFPVLVACLPDGEKYKTLDSVQQVYTAALEGHLDRASFIVALGGGVIGDLAGFAAATFMRGISFIQVPTTLLAQVDSSIGGKTGVNHPLGKNLIGAFHQPKAVVCDLDVLSTLPQRQLLNGLSEVVKHGIIGDSELLEAIAANPEQAKFGQLEMIEQCVVRSLLLKGQIVSQDEREAGVRAVLNFGHTMGHAVEQVAGYGKYTHGEAVAIGMRGALELSEKLGMLEPSTKRQLVRILSDCSLPTAVPGCDPAGLLSAMFRDKKNRQGRIRFVLLEEVERPVVRDDVPPEAVQEVLEMLTA